MKNRKILSSFACCKKNYQTIGHKLHGSVQFMKAKSNDQDQSDLPVLMLEFDMTCMSRPCIYPPCNLDISSKLHFLLFFVLLNTVVSRTWMLQVSWQLTTGTPRSTMKGSSSVALPAGFKPRTYLEGSAFHCWEMFSDAKRIQNCRVVKFESQVCFSQVEGLKWFKQLVEICSVHISNE